MFRKRLVSYEDFFWQKKLSHMVNKNEKWTIWALKFTFFQKNCFSKGRCRYFVRRIFHSQCQKFRWATVAFHWLFSLMVLNSIVLKSTLFGVNEITLHFRPKDHESFIKHYTSQSST